MTAAFTNAGAILLSGRGVPIDHRLDWAAKNDTSHYFLTHTLAVAETMLQVERAARSTAICLIDHTRCFR